MPTSPSNSEKIIEGKKFDSPLIISKFFTTEPERYIAEKPFDLTKYEFSVLRKRVTSELLFTAALGATVGVVLTVLAKVLAALLEKNSPTVETWELYAVGCGLAAMLVFKIFRTDADKEYCQLEDVIDGHFQSNKPRMVHLTGEGNR